MSATCAWVAVIVFCGCAADETMGMQGGAGAATGLTPSATSPTQSRDMTAPGGVAMRPTGMAAAAGGSGSSSSTTVPSVSTSPSATPMPGTAMPGTAMPVTPVMPGAPNVPPADSCGLSTKFRGDEFCVKPPPADKGFQLHLGPTDYANPEPEFLLEPGAEVTETFPGVTGNDRNVYYFYRQQRMRPGSHHLLIRTNTTGELIVSAQNPISDTPVGGKPAPENEDVGFPLAPRTPLSINVHFINTTDKPILKEVWVNFWYKDASAVKEPASTIFTGTPINIPPGQHVVLSSDCPISGTGRLLRLFGHKHANNVRWSSYRVRGGQKELLFEDYEHWEEPLILEYDSVTKNPTPNAATKTPGGFSGIVDLMPGDVFRFECEVVNNTTKTFTGKNEAVDDEMCIQNGTVVGTMVGGGAGMLSVGCRSMQTRVSN